MPPFVIFFLTFNKLHLYPHVLPWILPRGTQRTWKSSDQTLHHCINTCSHLKPHECTHTYQQFVLLSPHQIHPLNSAHRIVAHISKCFQITSTNQFQTLKNHRAKFSESSDPTSLIPIFCTSYFCRHCDKTPGRNNLISEVSVCSQLNPCSCNEAEDPGRKVWRRKAPQFIVARKH
jgi:hypothetical protein